MPSEGAEADYRYIVGIDLGTTNSALAYVDLTAGESPDRRIHFLMIPQLTAPGELGHRPVLPSFLYLPGPYEMTSGSLALPWDPSRNYAVGELAREQGALVPGRLVTSAKSWLCHGGVDRTAPILPWGAGTDVPKVSPVAASARYLQHLKEAWNETMASGDSGNVMEEQLIILTVPASFDEVARELTLTAARDAGLTRVILLEEPLAAFYAWLSQHQTDWERTMQPEQIILVCDVGGGTTDFTIIAIRASEKGLKFDRLAVGEHLMLGGDNMDLSLAHHIESRLFGKPGQLDSRRWHQLWHQCRKAKETLLSAAESESTDPAGASQTYTVTIMGSGSKLIGDTLKGELTGSTVQELIVEGFFPFSGRQDFPRSARRAGLTEWGLPYVQDPAVTRHLAAFWHRSEPLLRMEINRRLLTPDFILFNGGALTPRAVRRRILETVHGWFSEDADPTWFPAELTNPRPELAVAVGAAYYGLVRLGEGVRVGAGSPRGYYVEVAAPGTRDDSSSKQAVCIVPRGTEEGFDATLQAPAFEALTNQPASFQLFSSFTRLGDQLGQLVTLPGEEISILPPIRTVLRYGKRSTAQRLPVQLRIHLTEIGTLELWCQSLHTPHRWQLQFDVRDQKSGAEPTTASPGETLDAAVIESAQNLVRQVFCQDALPSGRPPERLVKDLTSVLELPKDKWPTSLIRKIADTLMGCRHGRQLTAQHESRWLNLLGFSLRPGFGDPLDDWRMKEVWKLFPAGLHHPRQPQVRSEWWVLWRRVAGGMTAGQQWHIYQNLSPLLSIAETRRKPLRKASRNIGEQEQLEMWMALANFESLPQATKIELGRIILARILKGRGKPQELWALGRFGARVPFYGPLDQVIPSQEAAHWVNRLLELPLEPGDASAQTLVQLARRTGDRERDLPPAVLERVEAWLGRLPHPDRYRELLTNPDLALLSEEKEWIFGESLPTGLAVARQ